MRGFLPVLIVWGLFISCSDLIDETSRKEFEMIEFRSNVPVGQATINLYKCTGYNAANECIQRVLVAKYITNSEGKTNVAEADINLSSGGIEMNKEGYWTQAVSPGRNEINREGWLQIQVMKVNQYPAGSQLFVYNRDERSVLKPSFFTMQNLHDTVALVRAYGGQNNLVSWTVSDGVVVHASGNLAAVFVPTTGSASTGFSY
jgi:hypothetical protein